MANRDNAHGFIAEKNIAGDRIPVWEEVLASNQAVVQGMALMASAGLIYVAPATTTAIVGVATDRQTSTTTANTKIAFVPAVPWVVFSGQCSGTPTQTSLWTDVDIEGSGSTMEINENATAISVAHLIGFRKNTSIGLNAEVLFVWNTSAFTGKVI